MRAPLLAILVAALGCGPPAGVVDEPTDPVVVVANVERADPVPGRPFDLTITVNKADDVEFRLPDVGAELKGLVVQKQRTEGPERIGDRLLTREIYTLKAPISGVYRIPGVDAPYRAPGDVVGTVGTAPILIEAGRLGDEESQGDEVLRDLKALAAPDPDLRPLVASGALAVLVLVGLIALLLRRKRDPAAPPPVPPHERALRELDTLLAGELLRDAEQGPFAYEVSAILRRYLEAQFEFRAWRMTTPELLRALPSAVSRRHDIEAAIRNVLEASDYVKFAAQEVPVETLRGWGAGVRSVVDATRGDSEAEAAP